MVRKRQTAKKKSRNVLGSAAARSDKNTGIPYEILVQSIFQEIHDQQSVHTIRVERNMTLQGRDTTHQIDVYWEFSVAGITYRTIVQAKDWKNRIKKEYVLAFTKILDDIPGQPRGVMITRTGFQQGARSLANKHGIQLYLLRQFRSKGITITDIGWGTYRYDPATHIVHVTTFRPDFNLKLIFARPSLPPIAIRRHPPRDLRLFDEKGASVGTVRDIVAEFVAELQKTGTRTGSFNRDFKEPTFLKYPGQNRQYHLTALKTDMKILEEPQGSFPLLPPGIVEFILEDLKTGKAQTYRRGRAGIR